MKELIVGDKAPEFDIEIMEGNKLALSELKGKYVVLYFYPKDNTPGCTVEAKDFNAKLDEFNKLGAEIIGISKDDLNSHDKFRDKYDLKFKLGADVEGKMCEDYGVWAEKSMFGKNSVFISLSVNISSFLYNISKNR